MPLTGDISGSYGKSSVIGITGSIDLTYDGSGTEDGWIQLTEMTGNPTVPGSNQGKIFVKDDGAGTTVPYFIDRAGTVATMIGSETAAGSDTQVQYNNGGSLGGASALVYDDSNNRVGIGTASPSQVLSVYGDVSGDYVAVIDNDENSAGHGLKITGDGSGTGTNLLDVESGSTTVFRVRADGKVAIGETSEGGIPTQVEALTVNGDLSFRDYLKRRGDSNTYIGMPSNDQMELVAGGVTFVSIVENDSQDKITFNDGGADVDFIVESPNESLALYLNAGNEVFHINHGESAFKTKIHSTNGEAITVDGAGVVLNEDGTAANDFRVESDSNTHMFFVDAGNEKIGIGTDSPSRVLTVSGSEASAPIAGFANDGNNSNRYGLSIACGVDNSQGGGSSGDSTWFVLGSGNGTPLSYVKYMTSSPYAAFTGTSDKRLKTDIAPTKIGGLDVLEKLELSEFRWKNEGPYGTLNPIGFIAQNCEEAYPPMVTETPDHELGFDVKGVAPSVLIPVLVKAIQELSARVSELEKK
jgi:hypothetical protein